MKDHNPCTAIIRKYIYIYIYIYIFLRGGFRKQLVVHGAALHADEDAKSLPGCPTRHLPAFGERAGFSAEETRWCEKPLQRVASKVGFRGSLGVLGLRINST